MPQNQSPRKNAPGENIRVAAPSPGNPAAETNGSGPSNVDSTDSPLRESQSKKSDSSLQETVRWQRRRIEILEEELVRKEQQISDILEKAARVDILRREIQKLTKSDQRTRSKLRYLSMRLTLETRSLRGMARLHFPRLERALFEERLLEEANRAMARLHIPRLERELFEERLLEEANSVPPAQNEPSGGRENGRRDQGLPDRRDRSRRQQNSDGQRELTPDELRASLTGVFEDDSAIRLTAEGGFHLSDNAEQTL